MLDEGDLDSKDFIEDTNVFSEACFCMVVLIALVVWSGINNRPGFGRRLKAVGMVKTYFAIVNTKPIWPWFLPPGWE